MPRAYIGLGSNQGEAADNLRKALKLLDRTDGIKVITVSSLYLAEPVGYEDQPWFHNCVVGIDTELPPSELLEALQHIENSLGRVRTIRWGPRTVDLDILLYDRLQLDTEQLIIPHPRMTERAFVMVPLTEIAGEFNFPDGTTVTEISKRLTDGKKCSCIPPKIW